jgi:hypothetical protein
VTDRARTFDAADAPLLDRGIMKIVPVGQATVRIIDSPRMLNLCVEAVRQNPDWLAQQL